MSIIYILIPVAILLTALGIYLFFWAVKTNQFDDLEKQGMSILFEQDDLLIKEKQELSTVRVNKTSKDATKDAKKDEH